MPTYEYECKSCLHRFDIFQSMSDEPLKICPECGKELRRLINGGTGVIFKGGGFYVTDKNSGGNTARSSESAKTAGDKSGGSESPACANCPASSGKADAPSCPKAANG